MDPIVDERVYFNVPKKIARAKLGFNMEQKIFLYYGTFVFSKGADILLKSIKSQKLVNNTLFLLAGPFSKINYEIKSELLNLKKIRMDDKLLNKRESGLYFSAADVIVLPYKKFYEHGDSAVLVQACLSNTPVIAPDIVPFSAVVKQFKIGKLFKCESVKSLANVIKDYPINTFNKNATFKAYLEATEDWNTRAELIISYINN